MAFQKRRCWLFVAVFSLAFTVASIVANNLFAFEKIIRDDWRDKRHWEGPFLCELDKCSTEYVPCSLVREKPIRGFNLLEEETCSLVRRTYYTHFSSRPNITLVQIVGKEEGERLCGIFNKNISSPSFNTQKCYFSNATAKVYATNLLEPIFDFVDYDAQQITIDVQQKQTMAVTMGAAFFFSVFILSVLDYYWLL